MSGFLKLLLSLSLSGTLLSLALFLFKPLWKERLGKQWQYYIWLIVIARLLLPFAPQDSLVGSAFERLEAPAPEAAQWAQAMPEESGAPAGPAETDAGGGSSGADEEKPTPSPAPGEALPVSLYAFLVWLIAALLLFVRKVTIYQGFARYIRAGQKPVEDIGVLNRFGALLSEKGIKRPVELAANPLISSPLMMGLLRPCIVLPDIALPDADFCCTIQHELTHYKRRDMLYKWLVQLAVCIHWFNPLVHLVAREISRACELSCDEAVISRMDAHEKAAYGDTLLSAMQAGGSYKDSLACVTLHENKALLRERLDAIMSYRKKTRFSGAISLLLTFALCAGAAASGAYKAQAALAADGLRDGGQGSSEPVAAEIAQGNAEPGKPRAAGYWRYFNYYYHGGRLFGVGWRERDALSRYTAQIHVAIGGTDYPVAFMDATQGLEKDQSLCTFIASCISEIMESGWAQERPASGFWAVSHIYAGETPDETMQLALQGNDTLAIGPLMPYVKRETVEQQIQLAFEKDDTNVMMFLLSESAGYFAIHTDSLAQQALDDANLGMYMTLEPYISPEHAAELKQKAKERFFSVPQVAGLPDLPPLPPLPPLSPVPTAAG